MHHSVIEAGAQLQTERCTSCCNLFHCPLCPKLKGCKKYKIKLHIESHEKKAIPFKDKKICRCSLDCRAVGHFHCPTCHNTKIRRCDMEKHLVACQGSTQPTDTSAATLSDPGLPPSTSVPLDLSTSSSFSSIQLPTSTTALSSMPPAPTVSPLPELTPPPHQQTRVISSSVVTAAQETKGSQLIQTKQRCPHCNIPFLKKNMTKHIQRKHSKISKDITGQDHLHGICIDATNGLFAVQKTRHGFSVPKHVQNKTWGHNHKVQCELEECRQYQLLAVRSGLPSRHCEHIRSLQYCTETANEEFLQENVLAKMVELQFFGEAKKATCLKRQRNAQTKHVPLCVPVSFQETQRQLCFSVYEPTLYHYSRLGRVMVTFNTTDNTWHCPCAKPRISCIHKNISKWHVFQTNPDLFKTETVSTTTPQQHQGTVYPPNDEELRRLVDYLYIQKKLPAKLPDELLKPKALTHYLTELHPTEAICTVCPGSVHLENSTRITGNAKIISMNGVINVSTYFRRCPQCKMVYRYQEWRDGLHNFDDHLVLSLELCLYLRHNLQNNVSVSKVMKSLESLRKVTFPASDTIAHAYYHFEALTDHEHSFSCVCCGYHPPVVVMDLHKKGVFNLPVSDIKEPSEDFTGEVNVEEFWNSIQKDMISRGFFPSHAKNKFSIKPSFEHWAPWIGKNTRRSEMVLNTEYEKVVKTATSSTEADVSMVSEDRLCDELMKQKVSTVRKLCKACNLDSKGSRMDLVIRLKEEMKTRHLYDKIFQKIWGASGGWSVILCPHGVAYSLKFNLRAESPRDFADLLLSWKHLPNVSVYDFARGLSTHVNTRFPASLPFKPHEGRLAASTQDNITAAQQKKLKISLPWLTEMSQSPEKDGHPLTGSSDHYVLYDKFHEANTRDPQEVLRRINLVPELQGSLNSQVAEQFFSSMRKNNYFLNNMAPSTHIFLMRNLVHHKNNTTNAKLLEQQLQRGQESHRFKDITLNVLGQAVLGPPPLEKPEQPLPVDAPVQLQELDTDPDRVTVPCGTHCESFTKCDQVQPCKASWTLQTHPAQDQLLEYILDIEGPGTELIVKTQKACLTRADFWSLGLNYEMESTIGNACFELIQQIAQSKGKSIFVADLYVVPTWRRPSACDPLLSLPNDVAVKDAIVIPVWKPGHFLLSVLKPTQKDIVFLDSKCAYAQFGFGDQEMRELLRNLCQSVNPGTWREVTGLEIKGFPGQPYGNDCGIFMLMYALYTVLDASYDFTITDMPALRKWWCVMLMENFDLGSHGKVFAHWTEESKALLRGELPPVFRLGKRKFDDIEEDEQLQAVHVNNPLQKDEKATETWERILEDCQNAADWVLKNLSAATVDFPDILQMGDEDTEEAVKQLSKLSDAREMVDESEREEILEPFKFFFHNIEDMLMFCEEIVDKRGYVAYCECRVNDV